DSLLARISFLLGAPYHSLEADVQVCSLPASQERQSRALVGNRDASRGAPAVFQHGADQFHRALSSHSPALQFSKSRARARVHSPRLRGAHPERQTPHRLLLPLPAPSIL